MQPKFNVGDRVVYRRDTTPTGTIARVTPSGSDCFYGVRWDDESGIVSYAWPEEELQLAASQELANAAEVSQRKSST